MAKLRAVASRAPVQSAFSRIRGGEQNRSGFRRGASKRVEQQDRAVRDRKGLGRFGQYLKKLREERRLSLTQVAELSIPHQMRISEPYLSRCENGLTEPSLERLSILSKIYRTNLGGLVDRRENERELDEFAPIDVTGHTSEELRQKGIELADRGELRASVGCFRAAEDRALLDPSESRSHEVAKARISVAIVLNRMARFRLAKDEAEAALALFPSNHDDYVRAILLIAICHKNLGNANMSGLLLNGIEDRIGALAPKDQADYLLLRGMVSVEWYHSLGEAIDGLMKNTFSVVEYYSLLLFNGSLFYLLVGLGPLAMLLFGAGPIPWFGSLTIAGQLLVHSFAARETGAPWYAGAFYPLAAVLMAWILIRALVLNLWQGGIVWRGTFYPLSELRRNRV